MYFVRRRTYVRPQPRLFIGRRGLTTGTGNFASTMNYKKFSNLPGIELRILSAIGMLSEQRLAFKIDNSPNYNISYYDRHKSETYFFSDSHPFPYNLEFVINIDKSEETIIGDGELEELREELEIDGDIGDGEEILSEVIAKNGGIDFSVDRINDFELHGIEQPVIDNTAKTITFVGGYKAGYSGIQPDDWSVYVVCDVLGLSASAVENYTHLGILAEGLAMMLRKDYKIA
nr:hypothetical protein [uncultured Cupriavidus sp.]